MPLFIRDITSDITLLWHTVQSVFQPSLSLAYYFYPPTTNFRQFSLSFISCNLSYKQNIYSSLCIGVPSRSDASTQHHVLPTSQEFPIPLRLPTSILCHITSRLQYQFYSPVFFSLIHKYQQHALFAMLAPRSPHLLSAYTYSGRPQN